MADNTVLNSGTGGDTISTDDIAGIKVQRVKVQYGVDGSATDVSDTNPLPIDDAGGSITVDGTVTANLSATDNAVLDAIAASVAGTLTVDGSGVTQPVSGTVTANLSATDNAVLDAIAASVAGTLTVGSHAVTNAGTFSVQASSVVPGTSATSLGKAVDSAAGATDTGVAILAIRDDSLTTLTPVDGDYTPLRVSSTGALHVTGASGTTQYTEDTASSGGESVCLSGAVRQDTLASSTSADGDYAYLKTSSTGALYVNVAEGGVTGRAEDSAAVGGEDGIMVLAVRRDSASSGVSADGDFAALSVDSNGALRVSGSSGSVQYTEDGASAGGETLTLMGAVRRDTAASSSGTDGDYSTLNTDANGRLHTIAALAASQTLATVTTVGTVSAVSAVTPGTGATNLGKAEDAAHASGDTGVMALAVRQDTLATLSSATGDYEPLHLDASGRVYANAQGPVAHDGAVSGNPIRIAGRARSTNYTAVASDDVADLVTTLDGRLVTKPYCIPEVAWTYAAASGGITNTTGVTAVAAAGAGVRNYVTRAQIINGHATVGTDVQIRDGASGTVLWRGYAAADGGGATCVFDPPLKGTANTLIEVACGTTGSATYFNLQGYTGI